MFVLTERFWFCVLEYDPESKEILTKTNGDLKDKVGRQNERGFFVAVSPNSDCIVMSLTQGLLKIIRIDWKANGVFGEPFNIR